MPSHLQYIPLPPTHTLLTHTSIHITLYPPPILLQLRSDPFMAAFTGASSTTLISPPHLSRQCLASTRISGLKMVSFSNSGRSNLLVSFRRLQISCAAKPETVEKVCGIVKKQLALKDDVSVAGDSKFATLGADSLDTVEIVMALEEAFGITVEEESAQSIATVQDAADLIEKLCEKDSA